MKLLLLECVYRLMYVIFVYILLYSFSYLNQSLLLDYFSGLSAHYYQAVEFNQNLNLTCGFSSNSAQITNLNLVDSMSINESKSWSNLNFSILSYFCAMSFGYTYLTICAYYDMTNLIFIFCSYQVHALFTPGILNYQKIYATLVLILIISCFFLGQFNSHCVFMTWLTWYQEWHLERVDSELVHDLTHSFN